MSSHESIVASALAVAWPHRDSNGYALSTEHSHGRLSDWDHDLTSLVRSGLFTPPVVPASRIDGRRGREASAPERRKEDGGEGDAQVSRLGRRWGGEGDAQVSSAEVRRCPLVAWRYPTVAWHWEGSVALQRT